MKGVQVLGGKANIPGPRGLWTLVVKFSSREK